jgi:Major Facilitator Superfamily
MNDAFSSRAKWSLVLLTVINAVNFLDRGILNILLEPIKADLALTDVMLGLITGFGFTLVYSIAGVPIARLADRISRTRVLALGIILWSVMTSASALARSGTQLVMARVGVGIGEAAGFAPSQTLLSELFPVGRRAAALAIWSVGSPLGTFVGLAAGGYLSVHFGWRTALFSAGVPGLLLSILAFFTLKDNRHQAADTAGSPMFPPIDSGLRSLLRRPSILFTLAGSAFFAVTFSALASWGPTFFHRVHHLDLQAIGLHRDRICVGRHSRRSLGRVDYRAVFPRGALLERCHSGHRLSNSLSLSTAACICAWHCRGADWCAYKPRLPERLRRAHFVRLSNRGSAPGENPDRRLAYLGRRSRPWFRAAVGRHRQRCLAGHARRNFHQVVLIFVIAVVDSRR